jgi:hypothetical protein
MSLLEGIGLTLPLHARLVRAGHLEPSQIVNDQALTVMDDSIGTYFRPAQRRYVELGLRYELGIGPPYRTESNVPFRYLADGAVHLVQRLP